MCVYLLCSCLLRILLCENKQRPLVALQGNTIFSISEVSGNVLKMFRINVKVFENINRKIVFSPEMSRKKETLIICLHVIVIIGENMKQNWKND